MRNEDYKDDQKVFRYINSEQCYCIANLFDFLKEQNLPVKERWIFYLLGKFDFLNEGRITEMEDIDSFGGYYCGEVYFWSHYLKDDKEEKEEIRDGIIKEYDVYRIQIKDIEDEIKKLEYNIEVLELCSKEAEIGSFAGEGLLINSVLKIKDLRNEYEQLKNLKLDNESLKLAIQKRFIEKGYEYEKFALEAYSSILEKRAILEYYNEKSDFISFKSDFCEACQESPCRCSDPDSD